MHMIKLIKVDWNPHIYLESNSLQRIVRLVQAKKLDPSLLQVQDPQDLHMIKDIFLSFNDAVLCILGKKPQVHVYAACV